VSRRHGTRSGNQAVWKMANMMSNLILNYHNLLGDIESSHVTSPCFFLIMHIFVFICRWERQGIDKNVSLFVQTQHNNAAKRDSDLS
jgi:hypothetical protein